MNVLWRSLARMSAKLIFLLSVAGSFNIVHATELPVLGGGNAINSAGEFISTNTSFTGGASINGVDYQTYLQAVPLANVSIQARISVDPTDIGKTADLLYVIGTEISAPFDGGSDTVYISVNETRDLNDLNLYDEASVWMAQLATTPFKRGVTLQEEMTISDTEGWKLFEGASANYYFIGYRLEDGTIVYAGTPIVSTTTGSGNSKPSFPKLVQLIPTDTDRVLLAWLPSQSDTTTADAMRYEVHLSEQANFTPSTNTLRRAVNGEHQAEITGLDAGKTYNVLVVAVDQQGNQSEKQDYRTITTFTDPIIISKTTPFAQDKDLGLGQATTSDGVQFTYPNGGTPPQVGSILFINVGEDTYLRKVDSVTPTANGLVIGTSDAELTDIVEQGEINSEITLFDVNAEARRIGQQSGVRTSRSARDDGQHVTMRWQNDSFVAEQIDYTNHSTTGQRAKEVSAEVTIDPHIGFEPSVGVGFNWKMMTHGPVLTQGKVTVKGEFKASLDMTYDFKAAGSTQKELTIFEQTFIMRYVVGTIPVYQRNIFSLKAIVDVSASSEIKASVGASASAAIEMGTEFVPETNSWKMIPPTPQFEKSFTEDIHLQGTVHGKVRFIPNLKTEFYRMGAGDVSVEPIVTGDIGVESLGHADILEQWDYLKTQLTRFDIHFQLEAFVGFSAGMFSKKFPLLAKTKVWESPNWLLFSLPQLSVEGGSGKVGEPIVLAAKTTNGENNPFNEGSIQWNVYPPGKATVSGGKTGLFTATEDGTYTVFFSGASRIPSPLGRQFAQTEVSVGKKEDPKRAAHGIPTRCLDVEPKLCLKDVVQNRCNTLPPGAHGNTVKIKKDDQEVEVKNGQWTYVPEDASSSNGIYTIETYSLDILNGYQAGWSIVDCTPGSQHGNYVNGKKDGVWYDIGLFARLDQVFKMATWSSDVLEGPAGTWYSIKDSALDCTPKYYGSYKNGKQDGVWSGVSGYDRYTESNYVDGILDGPSGSWTPSYLGCRPVDYHGTFVKGKKEGVWLWIHEYYWQDNYDTRTFVNDVRQGPHGEWKADGSPRGCHGNYANDKQVGVWTCYKDDGTTYTETYVDGVKQK